MLRTPKALKETYKLSWESRAALKRYRNPLRVIIKVPTMAIFNSQTLQKMTKSFKY
jgi:hypothetical protein